MEKEREFVRNIEKSIRENEDTTGMCRIELI